MSQQALIEVTERSIGDESIQTVNARDLHEFLEIRKDFSDWIKAQLGDLFTQGIDFEAFPQKGEKGNRPRIEYVLTLECGKHVAMMSRTAKGRDIRDYFIACERQAKSNVVQFKIPTTLSGALRLAAEQAEQIELQSAQLEAQKPAVEFVERYTQADGNKGFREVAKLLNANEREFGAFLISNNIMYRLNGRLTAYAHHQHAERFAVKAGIGNNDHAFTQSMFTPKGIAWIAEQWAKYQTAAA
jgi:phage antirepressor YoqD-like protein